MRRFSLLHLNEFAAAAAKTAVYPKKDGLMYLALGLAGEVGEVCNKIKKIVRGDYLGDNDAAILAVADIRSELGDCLWYLSQLPQEVGTTFEDVAADNLKKLADRASRNAVRGAGDNR
jgi:NTP pyrophosphatase (non-canonical NTP hydrolase)